MWEVSYHRGIDWNTVERKERESVDSVIEDPTRAFLLAFEPLPTFTRGLSGSNEDLLWEATKLQEMGASVMFAGRGGKWTYHGPGQIVLFPIVSLPQMGFKPREVRRFIDGIRQNLLDLFREWNLDVEPEEAPYGIYCRGAKLASFGFSFKRGVAHHGVAIYYSPQQAYFAGINPCGFSQSRYTSLEELGVTFPYEEALELCALKIKQGFQPVRR